MNTMRTGLLMAALMAAANHPPPMVLRVNARRGSAAAYLQRLADAGLQRGQHIVVVSHMS